MKIVLSLLLLLALTNAQEEDHDHETCACAAEENGFTIDCSDQAAMDAATTALKDNNCATNCESELCKKNFLIVLAHHDYCLDGEITDSIENDIHDYEDSCEVECEIIKKNVPGLEDCPDPVCDGGNDVYNAMVTAGCDDDCSSTDCQANFKQLKAVHDLCDEDALTTATEQGYHDMEESCEDFSCNVGDADLEAEQLVCDEDHGDEGGDDDDEDCLFSFPGLGCSCFSGSATVQTTQGTKQMKDLLIGDVVNTAPDVWEPVYGFAHYAPELVGEFLEISLADTNKLQVSESHLLQVADGSFVPAGTVRVGDTLYHHQTVEAIKNVQSAGIMAPYTPSGTLMVNGVAASCYVVPDITFAGTQLSGHQIAHTFEFPHRLACHYTKLGGSVCSSFSTSSGISVPKEGPYHWYHAVLGYSELARVLILGAALAVLGLFAATELLLLQAPGMGLGLVIMIALGMRATQKPKQL